MVPHGWTGKELAEGIHRFQHTRYLAGRVITLACALQGIQRALEVVVQVAGEAAARQGGRLLARLTFHTGLYLQMAPSTQTDVLAGTQVGSDLPEVAPCIH